MATKVVKTLKKRELELVTMAVMEVRAAASRLEEAQVAHGTAEQHLSGLLEMATGKPPGTTYEMDLGTGKISFETQPTNGRPARRAKAKPKPRTTAKKGA